MSPAAPVVTVVNRLLGVLPQKSRQSMLLRCERVNLAFGAVLCEPGERIRHAYFPIDSFIALIASLDGDACLGIGLIGNEGMFGVSLTLGIDTSAVRALVQGPGSALRVPAAALRGELERSAALRLGLGRYVYVRLAQVSNAAACTCFHLLDARLARWLLMAHDRAHVDHFYLTHALLAQMLGVRRSGVTRAAGPLQSAGLIRYSRGHVTVLDRRGLEEASCACYGAVTADYDRCIG
ncbi:MAG: Crp/Fnr family transcriptional regulator [Nevskia sp.]|nr:Crp/Fnr family transcriptional regulator [Nevskia sp.]